MVCYLSLVAYLCFSQMNGLPNVSPALFGIPTDKIVHFLMFLPFPVLAFFCYDKKTVRPGQALLFAAVTLLIGEIIAGSTELVQKRLIYRCSDPMDFFADSLGLVLSAAAVLYIDLRQIKSSR